jgi:hypothetical protein
MEPRRQPVATHGNGFGVVSRFLAASICRRLPPVATALLQKSSIFRCPSRYAKSTTQLAKLRDEGNCTALLIHDPAAGRQNLEQALARSTPLAALTRALDALAAGRGYSWEEQRRDLVSRADHVAQETRQAMNESRGSARSSGVGLAR